MKLLDIANAEVGTREDEKKTNKGDVVKYQNAVGLPVGGGYSWCQAFVYWCGLMAYGVQNFIPKTAGVLNCWSKVPKEQKLLKISITPQNFSQLIKPGYQFFYDHGKGLGHTGIVCEVYEDGSFGTIEGNSNDDGSREGYEVALRTKERVTKNQLRKITDKNLIGFAKWEDIKSNSV